MEDAKAIEQLISQLDAAARRQLSVAAAEGRFDDLAELTPLAVPRLKRTLAWDEVV